MLDPIAVVHESGYQTVVSRRSLRAYRKAGYRPAHEAVAPPPWNAPETLAESSTPFTLEETASNQTGGTWGTTFDDDES